METFTSGEVLKVAFKIICDKYQAMEYQLPRPIYSLIADDSDGHRTRRGFMRYTTANLLTVGEKHWVIALGEKNGSYPADPFDSDIVAVPLTTADLDDLNAVMADMEKSLLRCEWFNHSLIIAMADGSMECCRGSLFGGRVADNMPVPFHDLVADPALTDPRCINPGTLRAFVVRSQRYILDAPLRFASAIEKTLKES